MSIFKISNFHNFLIYYSKYLSSKLCIDIYNKVKCVSITIVKENVYNLIIARYA